MFKYDYMKMLKEILYEKCEYMLWITKYDQGYVINYYEWLMNWFVVKNWWVI